MIDLKLRLQSTYTDIAWAVSAAGFGMFFGALIGGIMVDKLGVWRDMLVVVSQLVAVAAVLAIPLADEVGILWGLFFITGITVTATVVGGLRVIVLMWQSKTPVPMHLLHFGFGLGCTLTPLVATNFLAELQFQDPARNSSTASIPNETTFVIVEESRVQLAFVADGVLVASLSTPFILYQFFKCYQRSRTVDYISCDNENIKKTLTIGQTLRAMIDPASYSDGSRSFGVFVGLLLIVQNMNTTGGEHILGKFVRTYSVDKAHFSRDEASYLDMAYWASFSVGRFASSVLAHYISPRKLLAGDAVLNTVVGVSFAFMVSNTHTSLWLFTILSGLTFGPLYAAYISYVNVYIEVDGVILTLISFSTGLGQMLYIALTGSVYDSYGPKAMLTILAVSCVLKSVIVFIFIAGTYGRAERFATTQSEDTEALTESSAMNDSKHGDSDSRLNYNTQ